MRKWILCLFFWIFFPVEAAYLPPVLSQDGMVVTDHYLASQVGADILRQGGNAMDAAVAVAYALAVVDPCCGNIGGGGFMLVHWHTGEDIMLDFRETAPKNIRPALFFHRDGKIKSSSELGYLPVGIPGTVMGLNTALKKYGTFSLQRVMAPAIKLAEQGFILNSGDIAIYQHEPTLTMTAAARRLFMPNGQFVKPGQRLTQKDLAVTLKKISEQGEAVFYRGEIARQIVASSAKNQGVISLDDLKNYRVVWRKPIFCKYRGYQVITSPPPSSGVIICEILQIVEKFPLSKWGYGAALGLNYNINAMDYAFRDRDRYLGDPAFVNNPIDMLLSPQHIQKLQALIQQNKKIKSNMPVQDPASHTTHFVVMDRAGNVISTTYTINSLFGIKEMAGNTGFFLNNELGDFTLRVGQLNQFRLLQGPTNLIAPNKRPLSSMSPTIVMHNGKIFMALGAAGGSTIITSITEALENVIDYGMNIAGAVNSPRYHTQYYPDKVFMEPFVFSPDTMNLLIRWGHPLQAKLFGQFEYWGQIAAILVDPNGIINGENDNRRPNGAAIGLTPVVKKIGGAGFLQ